jgi:energy-coupling factor transport system ATP-binding protein
LALFELNQVTFTYPNTELAAIKNLSLQIEKGQFVVLFGASGSGKSTLLRLLKKDIHPHGILNGEIIMDGRNINENQELFNTVGFVFQDPENQVVAEDVLHELVFGLENLGVTTNEMRSRVAEMVHYFGIESLLSRKTNELSGGMKQQLNLASVLLMQPDILLLDEPTSQLDPVSAREFLDMLVRLNEEFGMTIILAEHRLDEVFTIADKIVLMEEGRIKAKGNPHEVLHELWESPYRTYVPSIPSLYFSTTSKQEGKNVPLSVKEGRKWLQQYPIKSQVQHKQPLTQNNHVELIEVKDLFYRYQKEDDFVLKELNLTLNKGEIYALLGGNGSGKSTLLKLLTGILKPNKGKVLFQGKPIKGLKTNEIAKTVGYLPQNPKLFFIHDTVQEEIQHTMLKWDITNGDEVNGLLEKMGITDILNQHPYDLSGGELQKAALACVLLRKPKILLLDEPTKGLDPDSKNQFASILRKLVEEGMTILMTTHDVEFAAHNATICGMMFQGNVTSEGKPSNFFKGNFFYTTMVQRLFRHLPNNEVLTLEEAVAICEFAEV